MESALLLKNIEADWRKYRWLGHQPQHGSGYDTVAVVDSKRLGRIVRVRGRTNSISIVIQHVHYIGVSDQLWASRERLDDISWP